MYREYTKIKLFIIDDGSKDMSYDVCKYYAERDSRIVLAKQKNMGACHTRQRLIDMAKCYSDI
ncbi:MAG: glycosyltransferase family A protein [Lachnospiraceae bacterium]